MKLKKNLFILGSILFLWSNSLFAMETPYTLTGKGCSMTVLETGFKGENGDTEPIYYNFFAKVTVSDLPDAIFHMRAQTPNKFVGLSEQSEEELLVVSRRGIWGPVQLNGAFYRLGTSMCRTIPKKSPKIPVKPRP